MMSRPREKGSATKSTKGTGKQGDVPFFPAAHSYLYDFSGEDIRNLTELRDDIFVNGIIDVQQCQRFAALLLPAQVHSRNIDPAFAQHGTDGTDDAGLVVIGKEDHVSVRHHLERVAVNIHDARQP